MQDRESGQSPFASSCRRFPTELVSYGLIEMAVTYNEIKYSMPVLAGALLEVADVGFEVGFVEVEVTSVVDGFAEVVEVLDDEVLDSEVLDGEVVAELVVDVWTGRHWPVHRQQRKLCL